MESLEKPVGERVLQAMAQAYPDPVDLGLLSMVLGCELPTLQDTVSSLVHGGLARSRVAHDRAEPGASVITDKGMAVADGLARDAGEAAELLARLEAAALRQLLISRVRASHLPMPQADELAKSLQAVPDRPLVEAGALLAHQTVSDWQGFMRAMTAPPEPISGTP